MPSQRSRTDRDVVYSYINRLAKHAGKAGIRLEIPLHLKSEFKLLEAHGNRVRTANGKDVKRSIQFDDADKLLILNVKISQDDDWTLVTVHQAREAKRIHAEADVRSIRMAYDAEPDTDCRKSPNRKALGLSRPAFRGKRPREMRGPGFSSLCNTRGL